MEDAPRPACAAGRAHQETAGCHAPRAVHGGRCGLEVAAAPRAVTKGHQEPPEGRAASDGEPSCWQDPAPEDRRGGRCRSGTSARGPARRSRWFNEAGRGRLPTRQTLPSSVSRSEDRRGIAAACSVKRKPRATPTLGDRGHRAGTPRGHLRVCLPHLQTPDPSSRRGLRAGVGENPKFPRTCPQNGTLHARFTQTPGLQTQSGANAATTFGPGVPGQARSCSVTPTR